MNKATNSWDVRIPDELYDWRNANMKKPYYFKISRETARKVVEWLSMEYNVPPPRIAENPPPYPWNGTYEREFGGYIFIHPRSHIKTIFHEWYHHLDYVTDGAYDSDDRRGGPDSLGWQFADLMWAALTKR